ncbi:glycosyltransferase [Actinokineospora sp. NPDC004072]
MIVHVSDCFHPRLGGIEVQVGDLACRQLGAGHEVAVITATPGSGVPSGLPPVHRVCAPLPFELPVHPWPGARLRQLFAELRPRVVHVHVGAVSPFAWQAVHACLRWSLPLVVTVHSMWDPLTQASYRVAQRLAPHDRARVVVTAVSRAAGGLVRAALPHREIAVIPNGIDPATWRPTTRPDTDQDGSIRALAVGRLAPRKKPLQLVRLLAAANTRLSGRLRATIVGDGPTLPLLRRYIDRCGLTDAIRLTGRLDRPRIRDLLATAHLFLAPAPLEAFGIAALEARTAGVPVIARSGNGIADFIHHDREGLLCASTCDLVDALVTLSTDHPRRHRIAHHNHATEPSHCTWPNVLAAYEDCYTRATAPPTNSDAPTHQTATAPPTNSDAPTHQTATAPPTNSDAPTHSTGTRARSLSDGVDSHSRGAKRR